MDVAIFGMKIRLEIIIAIFVVVFFIMCQTCISCSCLNTMAGTGVGGGLGYSTVEGFYGASTNNGESSSYNLDRPSRVNTKAWGRPNMIVHPGKPVPKGVQKILNRTPQPVPLPPDQLSMFATTEFKPECCPNTYSNSSGCACMTVKQYNYLITRGGNNVPYSEY